MFYSLSYHKSQDADSLVPLCEVETGVTWEHLQRLNINPPGEDEYPVVVIDKRVGPGGSDLGNTMLVRISFANWLMQDFWGLDFDLGKFLETAIYTER